MKERHVARDSESNRPRKRQTQREKTSVKTHTHNGSSHKRHETTKSCSAHMKSPRKLKMP